MTAVYFDGDADKACDALVSDLLKDEEDAGETDVPEERSGEVTMTAESEEERRSPSGPPGLILSTTSSAVNSLSSPSYFDGTHPFRRNLALSLQDECLDEDEDNNFAEVGEAVAPESFEMFYPPVVAPPLGPGPEYDNWLAQLPSIGSANHFNGTCDRCCFHPKGRCHNGYNCQHCHYDHEKRKRKSKKKSDGRSHMELDARSMGSLHSLPPTPHGHLGPMMPPPMMGAYPLPPHFPPSHLPPPGPPGLAAFPPPWYPGAEPIAPPPDYLPLAEAQDPLTPPPAWEDYVNRLEEENRYLRSMLVQCMGPSANLPPTVIPSHRQPMEPSMHPLSTEYAKPVEPAMSPGALPFCPQGWDATRDFQVVP